MIGTWRVASRLARREVRRRPGRTALVSLLVAIPVAGMLIALVLLRAVPLEGEWAADLRVGDADILVEGSPVDPQVVPSGATLESAKVEERLVRTVDGKRSNLVATNLPLSGLSDGIITVRSGRAPRDPGEALLSPTVARDLDANIGDELHLSRPDGVVLDVVGIGERADQLDQDVLVLGPDSTWPWRDRAVTMTFIQLPAGFSWSDGAAEPLRESLTTNSYGWSDGSYNRGFTSTVNWAYDNASPDLFVTVRPSVGMPRPQWSRSGNVHMVDDRYVETSPLGASDTLIISWIYVMGVVVATVVGIVITAAFAVSGRRQVTILGQLAASGASPGALRRMLVLQGTWTGAIGVVSGVVLAWIVLLVGRPPLEQALGWQTAPFSLRPAEVIPVVAIGLGAATIAALVPARRAARLSILACLAGRRPAAPASLLVAMAGFVAIVGGLGLMAFAISSAGRDQTGEQRWGFLVAASSVALLLGACAAIPLLIGRLEPLADKLRGSWRVGVRSLARQRTRTGAVVAAIAVSAGLAVTASTLYLGDEAGRDNSFSYSWSNDPTVAVAFGPGQSVASATPTTVPSVVTAGVPPEPADLGRDLVVLTTRQTTDQGGAVPGPVAADPTKVSDLGALLHGTSSLTLDIARAPAGGAIGWILEPTQPTVGEKVYGADPVIATPEVQDLYQLTPSERASLAEHGALALNRGTAEGEGTLTLVGAPGTATVAIGGDHGVVDLLPDLLITPAFATQFGLPSVPADVVYSSEGPLPDDAVDQVYELSSELMEDYNDASIDGPLPRTTVDLWTGDSIQYESASAGRIGGAALQGLLAALVLIISMLVIAVNLWLAAAENREERDLLAVVGASPGTLRRSSSVKAVLLVLLGALIAVPLGFIPAVVITRSAPLIQPVVFPWTVALLIVVVVPVVTYLVTAVASWVAGLRHHRRDLVFRVD